jgi:hypothetical protein
MSRDALVVGINTYQHLPSLNAPANDAESVARCLESFGECRVLRMPEAIRNQKPAISQQAIVTTQMLEEGLIRLFKPAGKTIPQTAIFYYSGHGLQRHAGIQEGYLATSDVNPAVGHYGLSLYWLRRLLQESPVRQRVIILDCCNSGEFFNSLEADPGAQAGTDRLFMAASREYEEAYESLDSSHSVFTQALLSGLNPYKVKGGLVNGHSLTDTVTRQLKGELQQPLFESSGGEIILTRLAGLTTAVQSPKTTTLERLKHFSYGFCPFQGVAPFDTTHAGLFFGRETLTKTLVDQINQSRFCALVGASGTGKTSILKAGLMPYLNQLPQSERSPVWDIRYLTPGHAPLHSLAEAFVEPGVIGIQRAEQIRQAESFLQTGGPGLGQLIQALSTPETMNGESPRRILLIIDQFEELLRTSADSALAQERRLLIDSLVATAAQRHLPVHIVIGLRADYLEALQPFSELSTLVITHQLVVPAMTYDQLKTTIVGPLEKVGLRYDANLIYTLLLDVVGAPGDLGLLQMALKELWQRREFDAQEQDPPRLTLEAYAEMGGIRHRLSQRASQFYDSLAEAERPIVERIFLSLCEVGEGTTLSRRQVYLPELVTAYMDRPQVVAVLEKLVAARLIVAQANVSRPYGEAATQPAVLVPAWSGSATAVAADSPGSFSSLLKGSELLNSVSCCELTPHFDIAHESLIRTWPPLQSWLQSRLPRLKQQRTLETAAQEWHRQHCPDHPDYFLTKTRLTEAKALQIEHPDSLSTQAATYLSQCSLYARRCTRKRYLMRLLIPLSMATGMMAAYGHSLLTQSPVAWQVNQAESRMIEPKSAHRPDLSQNQIGRPSPQAGMVRPYVFNPSLLSSQNLSSDGLAGLSLSLQKASAGAAASVELWKTNPQSSKPSTASAMPGLGPMQPLAHDQLEKVTEWVLPGDATITMQLWCVRELHPPTCFTLESHSQAE